MDNNVLASLVLCKQKHLRRLNKRNSRRRALINIRHILLHATHTEVSSVSSNNLDMQDDNSLKTISCSSDSNFENSNHIHTYEVQNVHSFDNIFELSFNGPASDDMSEMSIDQQTSDEFNEYFNLSILFTQPNVSLHDSTNITKTEYCRDLLTLFRDATICKTHCDRFIRLICSGLPTLMKDLLNEMQVEALFVKRQICTICHQDLNHYNDNFKCTLAEERFDADIYDIDTNRAFCQLIDRLYLEITQYK